MAIDYDAFRSTTWPERLDVFSSLSEEGKADLVRSQISGWLDRHRAELSPEQIGIVEEGIAIIRPELYGSERDPDLVARMKDFENRARAVLTPAQCVDAFTMQWGLSCRRRANT